MQIKYPEIGICGLSCRLCPWFHKEGENRCGGCKSKFRLAAGCTFIRCAFRKKGLEFCWDCDESAECKKWSKHREFSKQRDSFKCYQKLEEDILFILSNGVKAFEEDQKNREELLKQMLTEFNEGRSKSYYCIAATVMEIDELKDALAKAKNKSKGLGIKEKAKVLRSLLDEIAKNKNYVLKLRK
jgi:hypothetical protein